MKKLILLMLFVLSFNMTTYAEDEPSELYAQSAVLMDGESGRVLFAKNGENAMANASTTKILTCILALEYGDMSDVVTASSYAASQPKVHLGVSVGNQFVLEDLLYSLMLESHNDSAVMIAEHISGTVEEFALLMNQKAKEIGCDDTYYITPNGLDASDDKSFHHTTATDLAFIMRYCIKESYRSEEFLTITQTQSYCFQSVDQTSSYSCVNHNSLLSIMAEAISGKTGYTNDAGYCYVGAIESEGRSYIVALLACGWPNNRSYKWSDAEKLFEYGMDEYEKYQLESVGIHELPAIMKVDLGEEELVCMPLKVKEGESISILKKQDEKVEVDYECLEYVKGDVDKETLVGTVRYTIEGKVWKVDGIYTEKSLKIRQSWWKLILDYCNV